MAVPSRGRHLHLPALPSAPFPVQRTRSLRRSHVDFAADARLSPLRGSPRARRSLPSDRRGRHPLSRFRQRYSGEPARPQPRRADRRDPAPGRDADACLQPLWQPAGRGARAAAGRRHLRRHRVLHQFGRRGGRDRDQDRARLPPARGRRLEPHRASWSSRSRARAASVPPARPSCRACAIWPTNTI